MHPDPAFQGRVRAAAGKEFALQIVAGWKELGAALRTTPLVALAIVDPYTGAGPQAELCSELRRMLREFPSVAMLAALLLRLDCHADLRMLGEWGISDIISLAADDIAAIRQLLRSARGRPLQSLLRRALPDTVSGRGRAIMQMAADVVAAGGQAADLARQLHLSMRTLNRWCAAEGLTTPRRLLAWIRILLAAELLDGSGRSIESVALACGYASDSGLRRAFQDFLGANPKTLRRGDAFTAASREFRNSLN